MTNATTETISHLTAPRPAGSTPVIMGILNSTPDSFSDGGRYSETEVAIERGLELIENGADLVDVGGESTRPGAARVPIDEEQRRVLPIIRGLVDAGVTVSVDTMNSGTALAASDAGAALINDVSGGLADPEMYRIIARTGVHYVAMHWRGHSDSMQQNAVYADVVADVRAELQHRLAELIIWGVDPDKIILDPGIGFAKNAEQNWQVLGHLPEFTSLGFPVLVGASRKGFLKPFAADDAPAEDRDPATAVLSALAAQSGAWGVRVHNVAATRAALDVYSALAKGAAA